MIGGTSQLSTQLREDHSKKLPFSSSPRQQPLFTLFRQKKKKEKKASIEHKITEDIVAKLSS